MPCPRATGSPIIYLLGRPAKGPAALAAAIGVIAVTGCGLINPNFETIYRPDAQNYSIEGALSRGFAAHPRVGYVQGEGDNPDVGSFRRTGPAEAGIASSGIYTPSAIIPVGVDGRFKITFTGKPRFVLIRVFAWDDVNNNNIRDVNENLSTSTWELKKEDQRGWTYNAPAWNQFNFSFNR